MQDKCVMCGEVVPEGRHVCPKCVADHPANKNVPAMRDKLIALIDQDQCPDPYSCSKDCKYVKLPNCHSARIADHLLGNGVIVPPCKVGDTVYLLQKYYGTYCFNVVEDKVQMIGITPRGIHIKARNHQDHNKMYMLGKTVFLTKEEAEQALKGGERK